MLTNFKITKLFGLYDYDLDFSEHEDDKIRFITATNGYGKSTILRLIDGIFNHHLEVFFDVPFNEIQYTIDGSVFYIHQFTEPAQHNNENRETLDVEDDVLITFGIASNQSLPQVKLSKDDVRSNSEKLNVVFRQIEMFFSSETCKFIDDRRLLNENKDSSELVRLADYIKDKLQAPDEELLNKINILQKIIKRSEFADKYMDVSPLCGFRFVSENEKKTKLAMSDLSSGEQHILLISLYMLFEAPQKAIVLIDEPEMSFHLSWQGDYLKNLREIVALKNVQCIIATHSPIIFDSEYELSIDLYEQMHKEDLV